MKKNLLIALLVLGVLGVAVYSQRVSIKEAVVEWQKPDLPEAVRFEEVQEQTAPEDENTRTEDLAEIEGGEAEGSPEDADAAADGSSEQTKQLEADIEDLEPDSVSDASTKPESPQEVETNIPLSFNLAVPFTSQAPEANWEMPYQEACEEASVLMVHAFYDNVAPGKIPTKTADEELLKMVEFENTIFGYYEDTSAEQTAIFISQFYGYGRVDVIENPTVDQIKTHISEGRPVILPAAGQQLGNPNFTSPGPLYHMLVIRGYTQDSFITNDPGTRNGEAYVYKITKLMSAMHDWNGGDVEHGRKVVIVIYPEE